MEPSKTNQNKWEWHSNTFTPTSCATLPTIHATKLSAQKTLRTAHSTAYIRQPISFIFAMLSSNIGCSHPQHNSLSMYVNCTTHPSLTTPLPSKTLLCTQQMQGTWLVKWHKMQGWCESNMGSFLYCLGGFEGSIPTHACFCSENSFCDFTIKHTSWGLSVIIGVLHVNLTFAWTSCNPLQRGWSGGKFCCLWFLLFPG